MFHFFLSEGVPLRTVIYWDDIFQNHSLQMKRLKKRLLRKRRATSWVTNSCQKSTCNRNLSLNISVSCFELCPAYCHFGLVALSLASVTLVLALIQVMRFLSFNVMCSILRSIALCVLINLFIFLFVIVHV